MATFNLKAVLQFVLEANGYSFGVSYGKNFEGDVVRYIPIVTVVEGDFDDRKAAAHIILDPTPVNICKNGVPSGTSDWSAGYAASNGGTKIVMAKAATTKSGKGKYRSVSLKTSERTEFELSKAGLRKALTQLGKMSSPSEGGSSKASAAASELAEQINALKAERAVIKEDKEDGSMPESEANKALEVIRKKMAKLTSRVAA